MNKQTFYSQLSEKLYALGIGQEYIDRHLKQFDGFFEGKSDSEIEAEIQKLGDLDRVSARIKRMTDKMIEAESTEKDSTASDAPSEQIPTEEKNIANSTEEASPLKEEVQSGKTDEEEFFGFAPVELAEDEDAVDDFFTSAHADKKSETEDESKRLVKRTMTDEQLAEKTKKFNTILACASPLLLIALLLIAACFALIFFAAGVVTVFAVAGLVAVTAAGTVVSVAGLIFSVTIMLSNLPIGLYECGISIMIGSTALLIGVLLYNFAVRLMPYVFTKLIVLTKFTAQKLKELFFKVKKEYIGL